MVDIVRRNVAFAQRIAEHLDKSPHYELMNRSPVTGDNSDSSRSIPIIPLNIVLFRGSTKSAYPPSKGDSSALLTKAINSTGKMYVTGTKWRGHGAIRIAVSNWRTGAGGDEDLDIIRDVLEDVTRGNGHQET